MATKIVEPINDKTWVQVVDQAEQLQATGERQLTLAFKGETQKIANCCSKIFTGLPLSGLMTILTTEFGEVDDAQMEVNWKLPEGWHWGVAAFDVMQLEAGQYSILKTMFLANDLPIDGSSFAQVREDSVSLNWQTYSVSPYRYCNEREHEDYVVRADGTVEPFATEYASKCSIRRHIEMAFTQNAQNSENNQYRWEQQGTTRELTKAEKLIMNKVAAGVNPVFHYPVVQHTRVIETNLSSLTSISPDVDTGIDVIAELPNEVSAKIANSLAPWNQLSGKFVYTGQSMRYSQRTVDVALGPEKKIYTYTFVDTFEGALDPDKNFYGVPGTAAPDDRWQFGVGPQPEEEDE